MPIGGNGPELSDTTPRAPSDRSALVGTSTIAHMDNVAALEQYGPAKRWSLVLFALILLLVLGVVVFAERDDRELADASPTTTTAQLPTDSTTSSEPLAVPPIELIDGPGPNSSNPVFDGDRFFALSNREGVWSGHTSDSGTSWTQLSVSGLPPNTAIPGLQHNETGFFALAYTGGEADFVVHSADGLAWNIVFATPDNGRFIESLHAAGGELLVVERLLSDDGNDRYTLVRGPINGPLEEVGAFPSNGHITSFAVLDASLVAVFDRSRTEVTIIGSNDGVSWTELSNSPIPLGGDLTAIGGSLVLSQGRDAGAVAHQSFDGGRTWQRVTPNIGSVFIVGEAGVLAGHVPWRTAAYSADGVTWSLIDLPNSDALMGIIRPVSVGDDELLFSVSGDSLLRLPLPE